MTDLRERAIEYWSESRQKEVWSIVDALCEFAEQENNHLIQQIKDLQKDLEENKSDCALCYSKDKKRLEQAKEIIKKLYKDCYSIADVEDTNLGLWEDDLSQAEQFLKEDE